MADINISCPILGLPAARELANKWMEGAAQKMGLTCSWCRVKPKTRSSSNARA